MKNTCEWRDCAIFPDYYSVSSDGRVFSKRRGKCLQPKKSRTGYLRVGLACGGKVKMMSIHRLVALAFIPNPENKPTVNHINEIKTDNRVENLEWATNREQNVHGTRLKRAKAHTDYRARNIDYSAVAAKHDYSRQDMCNRKRTAVYKDGELIGVFDTQKQAADFTQVSRGQVSQCVSGQKKYCKGYTFEEFPIAVTKVRFPENATPQK
jgi:hypothetical protein